MKDVKDMSDLRELSTNDVVGLLDELRVVAGKRAAGLMGEGRTRARRALGVPGDGAVAAALLGGMVAGVIVGAALALAFAPAPGGETRRRLGQQVDRVRERMPEMQPGGDGRGEYPRAETETPAGTAAARGGTPS